MFYTKYSMSLIRSGGGGGGGGVSKHNARKGDRRMARHNVENILRQLRGRRALSPYTLYNDSALLALN